MQRASATPAVESPPEFWDRTRVGILLMLGATLLWSTSGVLIKGLHLDAPAIGGVRAVFAGLVLAPFLRYLNFAAFNRATVLLLLLLMWGYTGTVLCFNLAIKWTTATNAIALVYTSPAWVFLFTCVAERKLSGRLLVPIVLILSGIGVILAERSSGQLAGNLIGVAAGLCFGTFQFLITRVRQPAIALVSLCNLFAAVSLFLIFPWAFRFGEFAASDWAVLAFLGVFQIAAGHLCFTAALQRIPATRAAILALGEPLLNPVWVYLFLGEVPSGYGFAGLAVILAGVLADFWARGGKGPFGLGQPRTATREAAS